MLGAARAVEAADVCNYLRDESPGGREILQGDIARIEAGGLDKAATVANSGAGPYIVDMSPRLAPAGTRHSPDL